MMRMLLGMSVVLFASCKSSPGTEPDTDSDADTDADTDADADTDTDADCDAPWSDGLGAEPVFEAPNGLFVVRSGPTFGYLQGSVVDALDFHVEAERSGACRLLTYSATSCDPACEWGVDVCLDSECVPYPSRTSIGDLQLQTPSGLTTVSPDATNSYFADTGPVSGAMALSSDGSGPVDAFQLDTCVPTTIEPDGDWVASLQNRSSGQDVELQWSNVEADARVYLRMTTGVATHGGIAHAEIECEGPDTGSLVLPGPYLDVLYSEGWSCGECGGNDLIRYRADQADVAGPVRFRAEAVTNFWFIPYLP